MLSLRTVQVNRYVTPLREGGSLPGIAEADDGFLYVVKFRGAGQGCKALIAELLGGEIARKLGFKIPEIVFAQLDEAFGRTEGDEEIQDLLRASEGGNLALHYLSGALTYDPAVITVDATLASKIVWLDSFIMNVDRTCRNTNMLWWKKELWLIDHGAAFYFHHSWDNPEKQAQSPFSMIKDHVLLPQASELAIVNETYQPLLTTTFFEEVVSLIPDEWLLVDAPFTTIAEHRNAYVQFLTNRLSAATIFINQANHARETLI